MTPEEALHFLTTAGDFADPIKRDEAEAVLRRALKPPEVLAELDLEASWHYDSYNDARIVGGVVIRGMADADRDIPVHVTVTLREVPQPNDPIV